MYFDSDREALNACISTIGDIDPENAKIVHIRNTLALSTISVSSAFISEQIQNDAVKIIGDLKEMQFCPAGNIVSPFSSERN